MKLLIATVALIAITYYGCSLVSKWREEDKQYMDMVPMTGPLSAKAMDTMEKECTALGLRPMNIWYDSAIIHVTCVMKREDLWYDGIVLK